MVEPTGSIKRGLPPRRTAERWIIVLSVSGFEMWSRAGLTQVPVIHQLHRDPSSCSQPARSNGHYGEAPSILCCERFCAVLATNVMVDSACKVMRGTYAGPVYIRTSGIPGHMKINSGKVVLLREY